MDLHTLVDMQETTESPKTMFEMQEHGGGKVSRGGVYETVACTINKVVVYAATLNPHSTRMTHLYGLDAEFEVLQPGESNKGKHTEKRVTIEKTEMKPHSQQQNK